MNPDATTEGPLVLFGGTFDPVHRAHINGARAVARLLHAPVRLLPNAMPPHKDQPGATGAQRLAMLEAAIAPFPELIADDWELRQPGPSFSLHTLQHFRARIGDRPLVLVMGGDSLASLHTWRQWREYPDLCHLAVLPRPGAAAPSVDALDAFPETDAQGLLQQPAGYRLMLKRPYLNVSASAIRETLARSGHCPALDTTVEAYIHRHHLYNVADMATPPATDSGTA